MEENEKYDLFRIGVLKCAAVLAFLVSLLSIDGVGADDYP